MSDKDVRLTCTNSCSTLTHTEGIVDATTKKLIGKLEELEMEQQRIDSQIKALRDALTLAGIRLDTDRLTEHWREVSYSTEKPFIRMSLPDACEKVLSDHRDYWLSKSQIEYLIVRGGYRFSGNSKNSVGVTLQRMIESGRILAQRMRGPQGNRYRWTGAEERKETDAPATKISRK